MRGAASAPELVYNLVDGIVVSCLRHEFFLKGVNRIMMNAITREPLKVLADGTAGPYIMLLFDQLGDVCRLLDDHVIRYSVEEEAISLDGGPETVVIDLARDAD